MLWYSFVLHVLTTVVYCIVVHYTYIVFDKCCGCKSTPSTCEHLHGNPSPVSLTFSPVCEVMWHLVAGLQHVHNVCMCFLSLLCLCR